MIRRYSVVDPESTSNFRTKRLGNCPRPTTYEMGMIDSIATECNKKKAKN